MRLAQKLQRLQVELRANHCNSTKQAEERLQISNELHSEIANCFTGQVQRLESSVKYYKHRETLLEDWCLYFESKLVEVLGASASVVNGWLMGDFDKALAELIQRIRGDEEKNRKKTKKDMDATDADEGSVEDERRGRSRTPKENPTNAVVSQDLSPEHPSKQSPSGDRHADVATPEHGAEQGGGEPPEPPKKESNDAIVSQEPSAGKDSGVHFKKLPEGWMETHWVVQVKAPLTSYLETLKQLEDTVDGNGDALGQALTAPDGNLHTTLQSSIRALVANFERFVYEVGEQIFEMENESTEESKNLVLFLEKNWVLETEKENFEKRYLSLEKEKDMLEAKLAVWEYKAELAARNRAGGVENQSAAPRAKSDEELDVVVLDADEVVAGSPERDVPMDEPCHYGDEWSGLWWSVPFERAIIKKQCSR
jgi:hypothetical protein